MTLSSFKSAAVAVAFGVGFLATQAASATQPLVSVDWLKTNTGRNNVVVLDLRTDKGDDKTASYSAGHVPNAISSTYPGIWRTTRDSVVGVLPPVETIEQDIASLGISDEKQVVLVPAGTNVSDFGVAARIYWTLKHLGHDNVSILDGGHSAWLSSGAPLQVASVEPVAASFRAEPVEELNISTPQVKDRLNSGALFLDARPTAWFTGEKKHPKAARYGRIPGAIEADNHKFFDEETGRLKDTATLRDLVPAEVKSDSKIVSYCNTGHWAATNWFVLSEVLGFKDVTLYDDSMVGWSQTDNPIASGADG
jgi:thiosulfate/3-mercaptopyruvate sulfurtransferase